jgi:predicted transcriptional regulator
MTTLDRLEKKGTLKRKKSGKAFVYSAAMSESELRKMAVQHLLEEYFEGSRDRLLEYLQSESTQPQPAISTLAAAPTSQPRIDTTLL